MFSAAQVGGLEGDDNDGKGQRGNDNIDDHPPHSHKPYERGEEEVALRRKCQRMMEKIAAASSVGQRQRCDVGMMRSSTDTGEYTGK